MLTLIHEIVRRTRQHHAIEHATIHLLAGQRRGRNISGLSDPLGFVIYGDVDAEEVRQAVGNALLRLQAGERELAIHPNCGTNLVTAALITTFATVLITSGRRRTIADRIALALPTVLVSILVSKPLGLHIQQYTTLAEVSDRWVLEVSSQKIGGITATRVLFE